MNRYAGSVTFNIVSWINSWKDTIEKKKSILNYGQKNKKINNNTSEDNRVVRCNSDNL